MKRILIKRIYEDVSEEDSYRILVDRIWPRGILKERAKLDEWVKIVAPSTELLKWFDHQADRFEEFTKRYKTELLLEKGELDRIRKIATKKQVTLVYSAKSTEMNQAVVLRDVLNG